MDQKNRQGFAGLPTIDGNDHEEKSSQRVAGPYILLYFGFYLLLTYIIIVFEDVMPTVIPERDIAYYDSNTFSEETARKYLDRIIGDQPRVAGTVYHFWKSREMKDLVDEIAYRAHLPMRTDWQFVSGDYWLASSTPHVNCYQNVSNVIAVLEGESGFYANGTIGTSLLVNCHYDSVPYAIGASDNGVFCAVMAETMSKLSRGMKKLKHNVIFLFNGAEESALMGSHGFLDHPWSDGVTSVINLDSAGMNGIPSVFQVTDTRVLKAYQKTCSKPNAQGLGEVLFASGIIPSDTDFRIFRDFGGINGIDIAFIKGGNVYHTRNDRPELIKEGVIQNAGDMLLSLVRELADSDVLDKRESASTEVYYDYMGLFMVSYSKNTAFVIDVSVGVLGLLSVLYFLWLFGFRKSSVVELLWAVVGRVVCMLFGLVVVALTTVVMVATTTQMRYLSEQWMVVPLYIGPYVIAMTFASHSLDSWRAGKRSESRGIRAARASAASRALASGALLAAALALPAGATYVLAAPLLLITLASLVSLPLVRYAKLKGWQHLMLEMVLLLPATSMCVSLAARLLSLLIPIMGRSGSDAPDYIVAAVSVVLASLVVATVSGAELQFAGRVRAALLLAGALCACAALAPLAPYRGLATQRHYWFHSQITTYDANQKPIENVTGVLVTKLDAYSVQSTLKAIKESPLYDPGRSTHSKGNEEDSSVNTLKITDSDLVVYSAEKCENSIYCNLPLFKPRFARYMKGSLFIKMSSPERFEHSFQLVRRSCAADTCVLSFEMRGPAYNTLSVCVSAHSH
ncbi:putative endoplasmic reticulum metallopeptidase 1-B isoform X4 [Vanessa cardui]|uniref:putative endoplasmic reticulum metallopeptidase 1-B isoform X4 n=1 Tax=Vanessa cardui TaxID=171605 RepID=UPI001F13FFAE|nr:putative endoplasmic reticulum metallopeptidase 1-B isoform X4 [Vanessa cardui]